MSSDPKIEWKSHAQQECKTKDGHEDSRCDGIENPGPSFGLIQGAPCDNERRDREGCQNPFADFTQRMVIFTDFDEVIIKQQP